MIAALFAMLRVAALQPAEPPRPIVVRPSPAIERSLTVVELAPGDEFVRADQLAQSLGGSLAPVAGKPSRARLRIAGVSYEIEAEAPYVRVAGELAVLASAPRREGDRLWLPLQFVTDVMPREGHDVLFDAERRELRAFAPVVASAPRRGPSAQPPTPPSRAMPRPVPGLHGAHVVVVDAGHGGPDAGMHGPLGGGTPIEEKDVTLGIAKELRTALAARGLEVVMTRTRDTLIALADRGRIANQEHGELFISIHVNAANPAWKDAATARGFETYFLADAKSEEARRVAALENESVKFETASTSSSQDPLGFIISDMAQNAHLRESSRLATLVQKRLIGVHPGPSRGVKQAGFKVLVTASMPAVLVEVGYGTNVHDAAYIASAAGQRAIAQAVADAAIEYLTRAEQTGAEPAVR